MFAEFAGGAVAGSVRSKTLSAGELRNSGVPLLLPGGAQPNLALILGGVGTRLEDVVSGFSAFARQGKVAKLRFQPQQSLQEKPLMSAGAAWIVRRILSGQRRPDIDPYARSWWSVRR